MVQKMKTYKQINQKEGTVVCWKAQCSIYHLSIKAKFESSWMDLFTMNLYTCTLINKYQHINDKMEGNKPHSTAMDVFDYFSDINQ